MLTIVIIALDHTLRINECNRWIWVSIYRIVKLGYVHLRLAALHLHHVKQTNLSKMLSLVNKLYVNRTKSGRPTASFSVWPASYLILFSLDGVYRDINVFCKLKNWTKAVRGHDETALHPVLRKMHRTASIKPDEVFYSADHCKLVHTSTKDDLIYVKIGEVHHLAPGELYFRVSNIWELF